MLEIVTSYRSDDGLRLDQAAAPSAQETGLKSEDSRGDLRRCWDASFFKNRLPQRVTGLRGLHRRLVCLPARQRE
jgi:hypothetical protein